LHTKQATVAEASWPAMEGDSEDGNENDFG